MEVTFNFLEIRAMNTYPEHQVMRLRWFFFSLLLGSSLCSIIFNKLSCPCTGCHRHRQDHLLAETTDPGPAGSHGQPHQLRPLPSLQQLHLRVSISEHPCLRWRNYALCCCVCVWLRACVRARWGVKTSWPTLTALDSTLASWQPHFRPALLFSSQMHSCIAVVCSRPISVSR